MRTFLSMSLLVFAIVRTGYAQAEFQASIPYRSFEDSPFRDNNYLYFYLEEFEDGKLNAPGVSVKGTLEGFGDGKLNVSGGNIDQGVTVIGRNGLKSPFVDSVDADDGQLDGSGSKGHSLWSGRYSALVFAFDEKILGRLPTHAGIVWTDEPSSSTVTLSAFDGKGMPIGESGPMQLGDDVITGTTGEDCFFGVYCKEGISRIIIDNLHPNFEVDHLQYGLASRDVTKTRMYSTEH